MTENEWLACEDPTELLEEAVNHSSQEALERTWRLLSCAACRRIWHLLTDERSRRAVAGAELYADHLLSEDELNVLADEATRAREENQEDSPQATAAAAARWVAKGYSLARYTQVPFLAANAAGHVALGVDESARRVAMAPELAVQSRLYRDIFGNPFRPVAFDPAWRTSDAVALAQSMYNTRNFGAMPILADALQDAGCDSADVLTHCRDANRVHVRGCWVCDLVLGKE